MRDFLCNCATTDSLRVNMQSAITAHSVPWECDVCFLNRVLTPTHVPYATLKMLTLLSLAPATITGLLFLIFSLRALRVRSEKREPRWCMFAMYRIREATQITTQRLIILQNSIRISAVRASIMRRLTRNNRLRAS